MAGDLPELGSRRLVLRRPIPHDAEARLSLGQHREIVEAYGGAFEPSKAFTLVDAEATVRFIENHGYAWVIDVDRFIGHIRFHSWAFEDR